MCAAAKEMGAVTKLDLTSDVTHLIVGSTDTPKYKYVARERPDIKVLLPSWLHAVRECWMQGEDVHIAKYEQEHRLPTFWTLKICVTGFNDLQERNDIAESIAANGASYHGDLTKGVSHLIAAAPQGMKYEFAVQWGIKIVTIEWFQQSLQRGMMLEESLFNPMLSPEERGKGATKTVKTEDQERSRLGKRKSDQGPNAFKGAESKRKLRRTASSKLESQSSGIWADMGNADASQPKANTEWDDGPTTFTNFRETLSESRKDSYREEACNGAQTTTQTDAQPVQNGSESIFHGYNLAICGFDSRKTSILRKHVEANGGTILQFCDLVNSRNQPPNTLCIAPHEKTIDEFRDGFEQQKADLDIQVVSDLWVEKCIFSKHLVDADSTPFCRPLKTRKISTLTHMIITPTSFSGIDLLHFSKAVKLVGLGYDETLRGTTGVLVCGNSSIPNAVKLRFAVENRIPVVKAEWFWRCLESGSAEPMDSYLITSHANQHSTLKNSSKKHVPRRGPIKDDPNKQNADSSSLHRRSSANGRSVLPPNPGTPREVNQRSQEHNPAATSSHRSQPLRELSDKDSNSQRPSQKTTPTPKQDKLENDDLPHAQPPISFMSHDDEPFEAPPAPTNPTEAECKQQKPSGTQQSRDALNDAIAHLRAHKNSTTNPDGSPRHRRHRPLGRAPSNPSSLGSRQHSMNTMPTPHDEDDEDDTVIKEKAAPLPSQALMYEHAESKLVRETLMRSGSGIDAVESDGLKRVESVGTVKDIASVSKTKTTHVQTRKRATKK